MLIKGNNIQFANLPEYTALCVCMLKQIQSGLAKKIIQRLRKAFFAHQLVVECLRGIELERDLDF
jgi:hypothetical protein